jgi:hypothetical protein
VKTHRRRSVKVHEGGRQHVLSRVLLHVVEAARPIQPPAHLLAHDDCSFGLDQVHDVGAFVNYIDDAKRVEGAGIERLTARRGVEAGLVEPNGLAVTSTFDADDPRDEFTAIRITVVQPLGHDVAIHLNGRGTREPCTR